MTIRNAEDLERAMQEYQKLSEAPADSPEGRRRTEIGAQISAFNATSRQDLTKGRPLSKGG
jgi:hypothetical protein